MSEMLSTASKRLFRILSLLPAHQLFNQLVLLYVGKLVYKLSVTWLEIAAVLIFSVLIEHVLLYFSAKGKYRFVFSPSGMSTGFSMAFMLGTTALWVYAAALLIGLGQKHFFKKISGAHFLNPSNFGITAALLFFPNYTYVTFTDWGVTLWFALVLILLGTFILWRVSKFIPFLVFVPYLFLASYSGFNFILLTHNIHGILSQLAGAGFLMYSFFFITDPKAIPRTTPFLAAHTVFTAFLCNLFPLLLGPKEVNLFLALTVSGFLVPLWRHLELKTTLHLQSRSLAIASVVLALATLAAYLSPWDVMRNTLRAQNEHVGLGLLSVSIPERLPQPATSPTDIWGKPDAELYEKEWTSPHVVKRPLQKQAGREHRFRSQPLPPYPINLTLNMLGDETNFYAGVAAGDINEDGYLDVILSRVGRPIAVLINDRRGGFVDLTAKVFPGGAPTDVDQMALADFNNDSRLDLLLVFNQYYGAKKPSALFWFDPENDRFTPSPFQDFAAGKKSSGGITVADLNQDKTLDFYISFGIDWYAENTRKAQDAERHVLYVSGVTGWTDRYGEVFDSYLTTKVYVGMTALFTDFNQDGKLDFLLGNDFDDPSFALLGKPTGDGFNLLGSDRIENNTQNSMSYFPMDADNDGIFELWENGISDQLTGGRLALQKEFKQANRSVLNQELERAEKELALGRFTCNEYQNPIAKSFCHDVSTHKAATLTNDKKKCDEITSIGSQHACRWMLNMLLHLIDNPAPSEFKYDVERFPKQLQENVLLQYQPSSGKYTNVIKNVPDASYTGFTWCGFPFDVDNDGLLDIYLTTGMQAYSHDVNRLLINHTTKRVEKGIFNRATSSNVQFRDEAPQYGVDSENDGRGAIIADFDLDGDGDLLLNNYLTEPEYYENLSGGKSLLIELRSRFSNYYGVGATIRLASDNDLQVRNVDLGGHWNTSQSIVQHFGLGSENKVKYVEVRWPSGTTSRLTGFEPGYRYIIYE